MRRLTTALSLLIPLASTAWTQDRIPGETWMRYADPTRAGWSADGLEQAKAYWDSLDSAAYLVVENGVVVVAWGDVERRYMCHSMRKSFMSGLYGLHVDAGTIDTELTMAELDIDDEPELTETEKTARIEDLLRARSGVYKLAAYEPPQNPKPPRGSYAPGEYWCYNNWDFNTLCTIFEQQTGKKVFEEFGARFAQPLGMQDYRVRDGYYHYELDKSIHPAYPFRLSARDSARYGLLYLYEGQWGDQRILSQEWVRRSTQSYSDTGNGGYAYMWWMFDDPPAVGEAGMYSAQGVGGQMIAVLPGADLVIVNRTDTYRGKGVGGGPQNRLVAMILEAKTGATPPDVELVSLEEAQPHEIETLAEDELAAYVGSYLMENAGEEADVLRDGDQLLFRTAFFGTYAMLPVGDDVFFLGDPKTHLRVERPANGERGQLLWELGYLRAFDAEKEAGNIERALEIAEQAVESFPMSSLAHTLLAIGVARSGDPAVAVDLLEAALELDPKNEDAIEALGELSAD